jgi:hypothetical protein
MSEKDEGFRFRAKGPLARRDEGEYPWWIFDRGATKPEGLWRENPSAFTKVTADKPGGRFFAHIRRWLGTQSPQWGFSCLAAEPLVFFRHALRRAHLTFLTFWTGHLDL